MRRPGAFLVVAAGLVGFALGYALPIFARLPSLHYLPLAGRWAVGARPDATAMGYYGQLVWGALGAGVGAAATSLALRLGLAVSSSRLGLAAAWALTALGLVGAWFTFANWP